MHERHGPLVTTLLVANIVLTLAVAGWATWAVADPEYWFPDAFAEKGPRGDEGPRGDRGPRGPQGPPGEVGAGADEALAAAEDAQFQVDDLASRVDNLEGVDPYELDSRLTEVEADLQDVCDTLDFDLNLYTC